MVMVGELTMDVERWFFCLVHIGLGAAIIPFDVALIKDRWRDNGQDDGTWVDDVSSVAGDRQQSDHG